MQGSQCSYSKATRTLTMDGHTFSLHHSQTTRALPQLLCAGILTPGGPGSLVRSTEVPEVLLAYMGTLRIMVQCHVKKAVMHLCMSPDGKLLVVKATTVSHALKDPSLPKETRHAASNLMQIQPTPQVSVSTMVVLVLVSLTTSL